MPGSWFSKRNKFWQFQNAGPIKAKDLKEIFLDQASYWLCINILACIFLAKSDFRLEKVVRNVHSINPSGSNVLSHQVHSWPTPATWSMYCQPKWEAHPPPIQRVEKFRYTWNVGKLRVNHHTLVIFSNMPLAYDMELSRRGLILRLKIWCLATGLF